MLFNSVDFGIFFVTVFFLYWLVFKKSVPLRNAFILGVSYLFYGMWDWRFLSLIIISSLVDFIVGKKLSEEEDPSKRRILLFASLAVNLGFLGFFKYYNFFVDSFIDSFSLMGVSFSPDRLNIILPVGISFYTFQTLSYTIDIYNRKLEHTKDALAFFAFVAFFPQLVAGPIERAKNLLPQFSTIKKPNYEDMKSGLLLMAWGLFKKIVIADRLAIFVDSVHSDISGASGIAQVVGVVFFAFQLYLDFSAYSDIAIGASRTMGFKLSLNFKRPYLASSFSDFWTRWHISLSTWFRDYLYIPLGGNQTNRTVRNIMIVFILSGLWHGASWNFVIWGALNGIFLVILDKLLVKKSNFAPVLILKSVIVSSAWAISLVFFRAQTLPEALQVFQNFGLGNFEMLYEMGLSEFEFKLASYLLVGLVLFEIFMERKENLYEWFSAKPFIVRWAVYVTMIAFIIMYGSYGVGLNDQNFIYFQF